MTTETDHIKGIALKAAGLSPNFDWTFAKILDHAIYDKPRATGVPPDYGISLFMAMAFAEALDRIVGANARATDPELDNLKRLNAELLAAAQEYADAETIKLLPATIPVFSKLHRLIEAIARATNQPETAPDRNTP